MVRKLFFCHVLDESGRSMVGHTRLITDDDLTDLDHVALTAHQVQLGVMAESGLVMASIDFSVDRDGRYYFLECNPAGGQYGWLEAKTGVRLTEAVADVLAQDWSGSR